MQCRGPGGDIGGLAASRGTAVTAGGIVNQFQGVDSEVGQLRAVLMHRPGLELQRITPRHKDRLLFGSLPWVSKARQEHDILCQELRDQGVEVLYFTELLQDALEYQPARDEAVRMAIADAGLGDELRGQLRGHLENLGPEQLAQVLIAGLTPEELKIGHGVVFELLDRHDFVLDPLPNLLFTKDSSFWIGDRVAVASLASERRRRETDLATVVYRHHPRFAGTKWLYDSGLEHVDGGDVLLLAPGVVAVGVGQHTTPAGAERLARRLFDAGLAHAVLAVPTRQHGIAGHLDTICAVLDTDAVVMHTAAAYTLTAHTVAPRADGMRTSRPQPFLEAAAQAMGIDRLRVIDSGMDPVWGQPGQWDDGSNVLAIGQGVAVSHERNSETNAKLEAAGVRVIRVPGSELGSIRGGPRCMTCPVSREPAVLPAEGAASAGPARDYLRQDWRSAVHAISLPDSRQASHPGVVPVPSVAAVAAARMPQAGASGAGWQQVPEQASLQPDAADRDAADRDAASREAADVGDAGDQPDRDRAELASASLAAAARAMRRPAAETEDPERQADDGEDQRKQRQPHERPDNGHGHEHDDDSGNDKQQHAKHKSTLRRRRKGGPARPVRSPGPVQPRRAGGALLVSKPGAGKIGTIRRQAPYF